MQSNSLMSTSNSFRDSDVSSPFNVPTSLVTPVKPQSPVATTPSSDVKTSMMCGSTTPGGLATSSLAKMASSPGITFSPSSFIATPVSGGSLSPLLFASSTPGPASSPSPILFESPVSMLPVGVSMSISPASVTPVASAAPSMFANNSVQTSTGTILECMRPAPAAFATSAFGSPIRPVALRASPDRKKNQNSPSRGKGQGLDIKIPKPMFLPCSTGSSENAHPNKPYPFMKKMEEDKRAEDEHVINSVFGSYGYPDAQEMEVNRVKCMNRDGALVDVKNVNVSAAGGYKYAINDKGDLYISTRVALHSQLLAGADVRSAGMLEVDSSHRISYIDNSSGHYRPSLCEFFFAVYGLYKDGYLTNDYKILLKDETCNDVVRLRLAVNDPLAQFLTQLHAFKNDNKSCVVKHSADGLITVTGNNQKIQLDARCLSSYFPEPQQSGAAVSLSMLKPF